jgi:hypothetical protein
MDTFCNFLQKRAFGLQFRRIFFFFLVEQFRRIKHIIYIYIYIYIKFNKNNDLYVIYKLNFLFHVAHCTCNNDQYRVRLA